MPVIEIRDSWDLYYRIDSNDIDTIKSWFDEILPHAQYNKRIACQIMISARFWEPTYLPDWPTGSANGYVEFHASDGEAGIAELEMLRRKGPWPYQGTDKPR